MNRSSVSPGASGRTSPRHSSTTSTVSPSSRVNVAATPVSSIFSGHAGPQHARAERGGEHGAHPGHQLDGVRRAPVVEGRVAGQLERGPAADRPGLAHQQVARLPGRAGHRDHEVDHLADGLDPEEAGDQDVGVRQVHLLGPPAGPAEQREVAALAGVQQRAEQGRGVEAGRAVPVDGAVGADQGHGPQVADDAVFLDRQVAPGSAAVTGRVITHSFIMRPVVSGTFRLQHGLGSAGHESVSRQASLREGRRGGPGGRQQAERVGDGQRPGAVADPELAEQAGLDVLDRLRRDAEHLGRAPDGVARRR